MKPAFPITVLDGPDCAGKTTLAKALVELTGAHHLHLTYRWPKKMNLYHQAALNFAIDKSREKPVVIDRWWMSEIAYANVFRGGSTFHGYNEQLDDLFNLTKGSYIICLPYEFEYQRHYIENHDRRLEKKHALLGRDEREAQKNVASASAMKVWKEYFKLYVSRRNIDNTYRYTMDEWPGCPDKAASHFFKLACDHFYGG